MLEQSVFLIQQRTRMKLLAKEILEVVRWKKM